MKQRSANGPSVLSCPPVRRPAQGLLKRRFSVAILAALLLGGCGLSDFDEPRGWSATKLYSEAKDELSSGNYQAAIKLYEKLEARYPYGRFAQQAQLELAYAHHKDNDPTSAARYSLKRGAQGAAANRAQYALKNYPQAPALEEALYVLVLSYQALGMKDLRDDAERVMRANFPQSAYLKGTAGPTG